jgi:hypothetical protein
MMKTKIGLASSVAVLGSAIAVLYTLNQEPEIAASPLVASKRLAPKTVSVVTDTTRQVPELVLRAELEGMGGIGPTSALALQFADRLAAPMRDKREKGPSGLWKLTSFYHGFRNAMQYVFTNPDSEASFHRAFTEWEASSPKTPTPYVLKAYVLRRLVLDQMEVAAQSAEPEPEVRAKINIRYSDLMDFVRKPNQIAESDPGWYMAKIASLALSCQNYPELWAALEDGSTKFPDLYQLYFETLDAGIRCSSEEPAALIDRIVELSTQRTKSTDEDGMYVRLYWYAAGLFPKDTVFTSAMVDWDRMKRSINDVLKRYPDAWNTNNFAKFACVGRQPDIARELLPKALEHPVLQVWETTEALDACYSWAMSTAQSQSAMPTP